MDSVYYPRPDTPSSHSPLSEFDRFIMEHLMGMSPSIPETQTSVPVQGRGGGSRGGGSEGVGRSRGGGGGGRGVGRREERYTIEESVAVVLTGILYYKCIRVVLTGIQINKIQINCGFFW